MNSIVGFSNAFFQSAMKESLKFSYMSYDQVRHRVNTKRPRKSFQRELLKMALKPKYEKRYNILPIEELCSKAVNARKILENPKVAHPLEQIVGREVREKIMNARLVAIYHLYPRTSDDLFDFRVALNKIQVTIVKHNSNEIRVALEGTKYERLLKLYETQSLTFISPEAKFAKLLSISKKFPFVALIGGIFEGRIISVSDFKLLAAQPNIESHQSQLAGLLGASGQKLVSNLQSNQQELCNSLQRYIADQASKDSS